MAYYYQPEPSYEYDDSSSSYEYIDENSVVDDIHVPPPPPSPHAAPGYVDQYESMPMLANYRQPSYVMPVRQQSYNPFRHSTYTSTSNTAMGPTPSSSTDFSRSEDYYTTSECPSYSTSVHSLYRAPYMASTCTQLEMPLLADNGDGEADGDEENVCVYDVVQHAAQEIGEYYHPQPTPAKIEIPIDESALVPVQERPSTSGRGIGGLFMIRLFKIFVNYCVDRVMWFNAFFYRYVLRYILFL